MVFRLEGRRVAEVAAMVVNSKGRLNANRRSDGPTKWSKGSIADRGKSQVLLRSAVLVQEQVVLRLVQRTMRSNPSCSLSLP